MKNIIKSFLILQCIVSFGSCDILDTTPTILTTGTFFSNEAEVSSFLTSVYAPLASASFYGDAYPKDILGDDLGFYNRTATTTTVVCAQASPSTPSVQALWSTLYTGIGRANLLLENADRATMDSAKRVLYKSEARFLRAFYYFTLVQNFGAVPLRTSTPQDMTNLSIPRADKQKIYDFIISEMIAAEPFLLKASDVQPGRVTQSALQGILARVYLHRAGEKFRDASAPTDSITAYFAHARDWALKVKNSGLHALADTYSQVFVDLASDKYNSTGKRESLWEVEFAGNGQGSYKCAGRIGNTYGFGGPDLTTLKAEGYLEGGLKNPGYSYVFIYTTTSLMNMYLGEKDTVRCNWNIAPFSYRVPTAASGLPARILGRKYYYNRVPLSLDKVLVPGGGYYTHGAFQDTVGAAKTDTVNYLRPMAKYRREFEQVLPKDKNSTPINFPILRYSDVLLMIAEAENEVNGPTDLAMECIDAVRTRAKIAPLTGDPAFMTKGQFRAAIKKERAMELCFEAVRRNDLIRWGDYLSTMQGLYTSIPTDPKWPAGSKVYARFYNVSSAYLYLPIPLAEMSVNSAIVTNNPGW